MTHADSHLSDEQLLLEIDGEVSAQQARQFQAHLQACGKCRARRQELENAITGFTDAYRREFDEKLPPVARSRALLKAQIERLSANGEKGTPWVRIVSKPVAQAAAIASILAMAFLLRESYRRQVESRNVVISTPDSRLTPGATIVMDRQAVCASTNMNNKAVPVALQKKVFEEYGLQKAEAQAYEVDYLITPALGGADDIRNLWPQSYAATAWNAKAKDELEERLREMVCNGSIDLTEAQHEIAGNWIASYKKYVQSATPAFPQ